MHTMRKPTADSTPSAPAPAISRWSSRTRGVFRRWWLGAGGGEGGVGVRWKLCNRPIYSFCGGEGKIDVLDLLWTKE